MRTMPRTFRAMACTSVKADGDACQAPHRPIRSATSPLSLLRLLREPRGSETRPSGSGGYPSARPRSCVRGCSGSTVIDSAELARGITGSTEPRMSKSGPMRKQAVGRSVEIQVKSQQRQYPPLPHGRGSAPKRSPVRQGAVDIHSWGRSLSFAALCWGGWLSTLTVGGKRSSGHGELCTESQSPRRKIKQRDGVC
jgi:hypothetical protein